MADKCEYCTEKCPQAETAHNAALGRMYATNELISLLKKVESGELVEVVRCKDCTHWCDCKVKLADGTYRDYLPGEVFGDVTLDKGINVGSHCTLHGYKDSSGSWFWARPDDFCSRAEKRDGECK